MVLKLSYAFWQVWSTGNYSLKYFFCELTSQISLGIVFYMLLRCNFTENNTKSLKKKEKTILKVSPSKFLKHW